MLGLLNILIYTFVSYVLNRWIPCPLREAELVSVIRQLDVLNAKFAQGLQNAVCKLY